MNEGWGLSWRKGDMECLLGWRTNEKSLKLKWRKGDRIVYLILKQSHACHQFELKKLEIMAELSGRQQPHQLNFKYPCFSAQYYSTPHWYGPQPSQRRQVFSSFDQQTTQPQRQLKHQSRHQCQQEVSIGSAMIMAMDPVDGQQFTEMNFVIGITRYGNK